MMDTATRNKTAKQSYIPFLQSCILLESLPKFADSLAHGKTIADYMPLLEASLFRNMREPLHFLTLADGMTQYWGQPVEVSPCCTALHRENINGSTASRNRGELLVKSVSYNVVDCDTQCGFMINIHYYKGEDFPSVGIVSNQYMNAQGTGVLQTKLRAPKTFVSRKENYDEDNFLSAPLLVEEVGKASFASMAGLIATLK
ncbi:hypothetical protein AGDE_04986 [Angomonas deanei]|nr:hypothetical protein AGDE_04986 [Angomonas deanei]|eukprot:EPY38943.1 hypothetical protein AGDE_04986 [Angomonas deanei]